ncbi:MAG: hypothetical protein IJH75_05940 [Mogibacterium sp.]|nr:hypothetical protein [Mogibacterium sp.]
MIKKLFEDPLYAESRTPESKSEDRYERFIREQERLLQCWEAQAADYIVKLLQVFPHLARQNSSGELLIDERTRKGYYRLGRYAVSPTDETEKDLCMDAYGGLYIREPGGTSSGRRRQPFRMVRLTAPRQEVARGIAHTLFRGLDIYRDGAEKTRQKAEQLLRELQCLWQYDLLMDE